MNTNLRETGIDILGATPWGMHIYHSYKTQKDLLDILLPYFKAGLENNELCMWITSQPLEAEDAKLALEKEVKNLDDYIKEKQLMILDYSQWYFKSGKFELNKVLLGAVEKEQEALEKGFDGLRVAGNLSCFQKDDWGDLMCYEREIDINLNDRQILAICSYPLDKSDMNKLVQVASHHQFGLVKQAGKWIKL